MVSEADTRTEDRSTAKVDRIFAGTIYVSQMDSRVRRARRPLGAAVPFERVAEAIAADRTTGRSPRGDTSVTPVPTANPQNRVSRSTGLGT
jgi:hypothetical protein